VLLGVYTRMWLAIFYRFRDITIIDQKSAFLPFLPSHRSGCDIGTKYGLEILDCLGYPMAMVETE